LSRQAVIRSREPMREDKEDWAGDPPPRGSWWAMLLLKVMELVC
jgi:hypothetical protein